MPTVPPDPNPPHRPQAPHQSVATREMGRGEAAAAAMFKANLTALDPTCTLRQRGEFIQAYTLRDDILHATGSMKYGIGRSLAALPGSEDATYVVYCRPAAQAPAEVPDPLDVLLAYRRVRGGTDALETHMLYDFRTDTFFGYRGKVDPGSGAPEFHRLVNPFDMGPPVAGRQVARSLPKPGAHGRPSGDRPGP